MTASSRGGQVAAALLKGFGSSTCSECFRAVPIMRASGVRIQASPTTIITTKIFSRPYSTPPAEPPSATPSPGTAPAGTSSEPPIPPPPPASAAIPSPTVPAGTTPTGSPQFPPLGPLEPLDPDDPPLPKRLSYPVTPKATHTLYGGIILSRPPLLTRALNSFEESFFLYQKRLNERLALPFMEGLYFKPDTAAQLDWRIKIRNRKMVPSREIGHYQKRGREAWNDEELVGSKLASTEHLYSSLLKDAEALVNDEGERIKPQDVVPVDKPQPRIGEPDKMKNTKRLDRCMDRTLYLIVKDRHGDWRFPHAPMAMEEAIHQTARRCLLEHCGENMNTWMVGRLPVAHVVTAPIMSPDNPSEIQRKGKKIFFVKGRIMAGQADLSGNTIGLQDFMWLNRDELRETLNPIYFYKVRNMMADR